LECVVRVKVVGVCVAYIGTGHVMGWGHKAIEIRSVDSGELDGVFMHKKPQKLKFLCERNDKVRRRTRNYLHTGSTLPATQFSLFMTL